MIRVLPTSRLPYIKAEIPVNRKEAVTNTSNALSASLPKEVQINAKTLGLLSNTAAYYDYLNNTTSSQHLVSIRSAWKNRKNP